MLKDYIDFAARLCIPMPFSTLTETAPTLKT